MGKSARGLSTLQSLKTNPLGPLLLGRLVRGGGMHLSYCLGLAESGLLFHAKTPELVARGIKRACSS